MSAALSVMDTVAVAPVLEAFGLSVATFYRRRKLKPTVPARARSPRALSEAERTAVLQVLHEPRFVDQAPAEVYATLLDEKRYLCSERTMYRVLADNAEVRERRSQVRHPEYKKPELLATGPNQVWSWDITKLKTQEKWVYLYLYVILDIFSRYVVGWLLAERENGGLAAKLLQETYDKQGVRPGQVILHADRGSPMKAKPMVQLMANLDVGRSHGRPHVSDDNPFSEAQFRTLKYRAGFPGKFGGLAHGLSYTRAFFPWYNDEHHHSGIAYLTPADVHHGRVDDVLRRRQLALDVAFAAHPERFVRKPPAPLFLPGAVYINPPKTSATDADGGEASPPAGPPAGPLSLPASVAAEHRGTALVAH